MKRTYYLPLLALVVTACTNISVKETKYGNFLYDHKAMPMDTANSIQYKWDNKPVLDSLLLDGAESLDKWVLTYEGQENVGRISLSGEKVFEGNSSVKFECPTKQPRELGPEGRYWGRQNLTRVFKDEDFSAYNRISFNVYPEFRGFRKLYLTIILQNDENVPDKYGKEGWHTVMLKNNQWNKMVMEIPHLPHNEVRGITLSYGLQGNEPGAADTIIYYVDNLRLEKVEADYYEGWGTDTGISFSHSGYNSSDRKTAFTSVSSTGKFSIVNNTTGKTVLEKDAMKQESNVGSFTVFDFTELKTPGEYRIVYGNTESKPFSIDKDVWYPVLEKLTNQYYLQRCGYEQPGIHQICHQDWYTVYKGDTVIMAGGWHDAGDLSQSYWQTASATAAFFRLARQYQKKNNKLSDRLIEEGLWGLEWLHKNRFDGLRVIGWTTMDSYTDNVIGNFDDKHMQPGDRISPIDNYYSIIADAEAFLALKKKDPSTAAKSLEYARDYWDLLKDHNQSWNTERLAIALLAGTKLYSVAESEDLKSLLVAYADSLMTFQQKEPMNWDMKLSGFFYQGKGKERFFGYNHSCNAASPILGLAEMCRLFPRHEKYNEWYKSVELFAGYIKTIAQLTAPYYMIPANIYKLNGTEDDRQIINGIRLDENHYLRMFPVWQAFRGNSSVILSQANGIASANRILKDPVLREIALAQMEWMQGKNPFSQSLMYGEGYNFSPQYAVFTDDIVGGLPVGILTRDDLDIPYWKMPVLHNYKELWGQPAFRMMELMYYLNEY